MGMWVLMILTVLTVLLVLTVVLCTCSVQRLVQYAKCSVQFNCVICNMSRKGAIAHLHWQRVCSGVQCALSSV